MSICLARINRAPGDKARSETPLLVFWFRSPSGGRSFVTFSEICFRAFANFSEPPDLKYYYEVLANSGRLDCDRRQHKRSAASAASVHLWFANEP
jgi:hypothetical protein